MMPAQLSLHRLKARLKIKLGNPRRRVRISQGFSITRTNREMIFQKDENIAVIGVFIPKVIPNESLLDYLTACGSLILLTKSKIGDPTGNRTRATSVKGRCPNR